MPRLLADDLVLDGRDVFSALSRFTLWASAVMSLIPAAVLLMPHFPAGSPLRVFLYLFVFPTMLGSRHARRKWKVRRGLSSAMAAAVTILMVVAWTNDALWILNWRLLWPAWYLFLAAWRSPERAGSYSWREPTCTGTR